MLLKRAALFGWSWVLRVIQALGENMKAQQRCPLRMLPSPRLGLQWPFHTLASVILYGDNVGVTVEFSK